MLASWMRRPLSKCSHPPGCPGVLPIVACLALSRPNERKRRRNESLSRWRRRKRRCWMDTGGLDGLWLARRAVDAALMLPPASARRNTQAPVVYFRFRRLVYACLYVGSSVASGATPFRTSRSFVAVLDLPPPRTPPPPLPPPFDLVPLFSPSTLRLLPAATMGCVQSSGIDDEAKARQCLYYAYSPARLSTQFLLPLRQRCD